MHVHLVFVTKYRRGVFDSCAIEQLREVFTKVCADFEAQLMEMDGEDDHVHLLVIAIEAFRPAFLAQSRMARKAADGAVATLKRVLIEAAERGGRHVMLVDPKHTTMDCSNCLARAKQRLGLSERTFHCPACGVSMDRDRNAARNVLARVGFHPAAVDVERRPTPSGMAAD